MAEYDEIKVGNLYKVRIRLFSDNKYSGFKTDEELKLDSTDFLILAKVEPISNSGTLRGVEIELSDSAFVASFLPVKHTAGDYSLLWRFPTTIAEFWERFDCING